MQFGSWAPDLPEYGHGELVLARNAYSTALGYAPVRSPSAVTGALPEAWAGSGAFQSADGTQVLLAGTSAALYKLGASATSKFTVSSAKPWYFAQYGDRVIGVNGGAPVKYTFSTDTAASLGGSPPTSSMIAIVRDFIFLAGHPTAGATITWSAINNSEGWTIGTSQCDNQQIPDGGNITGLAGGEYGLVFQSGGIHMFEYVGSPLVFTRRKVSDGIGAICQGVITQSGKQVFFLSRNGFFMFLDGELTPIGKDKVDRTFFETYTTSEIQLRCHAAVDPSLSLVIWSMPDRLWVYNWDTGKWSDIYYPGIVGISNGQTAASTLESIAVSYPSIEDIPVSFDDPLWRGGEPMLLMAISDKKLYSFGGADAMEAQFRLPRVEPFKGRSAYVRVGRFEGDATSGVTLAIDSSARLGDVQTTVSVTDLRNNGDMPIRCHGRYLQAQVNIASGTTWSYAEGLTLQATAGGRL